jgi:hypothetical protein
MHGSKLSSNDDVPRHRIAQGAERKPIECGMQACSHILQIKASNCGREQQLRAE